MTGNPLFDDLDRREPCGRGAAASSETASGESETTTAEVESPGATSMAVDLTRQFQHNRDTNQETSEVQTTSGALAWLIINVSPVLINSVTGFVCAVVIVGRRRVHRAGRWILPRRRRRREARRLFRGVLQSRVGGGAGRRGGVGAGGGEAAAGDRAPEEPGADRGAGVVAAARGAEAGREGDGSAAVEGHGQARAPASAAAAASAGGGRRRGSGFLLAMTKI